MGSQNDVHTNHKVTFKSQLFPCVLFGNCYRASELHGHILNRFNAGTFTGPFIKPCIISLFTKQRTLHTLHAIT